MDNDDIISVDTERDSDDTNNILSSKDKDQPNTTQNWKRIHYPGLRSQKIWCYIERTPA